MQFRLTRCFPKQIFAALVFLLGQAFAPSGHALPGFIAGAGDAPRHNNVTHVVLMKKGPTTVVTVWPDYEGALDRFALVLPVPSDVSARDVKTIKRDSVDHLDEITAPRFYDFWEMDPCEPGEPKQEWERDLSVKAGPDQLLGGGMPSFGGGSAQEKELQLNMEPEFKSGEYSYGFVPKGKSVASYLARKGLTAPKGAAEAADEYASRGMKILVAQVDANKVELAGARRALLSPIRFATSGQYTLPETLGLANSPGKQELIVYVLDPEQRYEVQGYGNVFPPTNVRVDGAVKERLGDFYAGVHDALLVKNPGAFLVEYAWPAEKHCGEPCPNAPMRIHELLTLGADVFEAKVPRAQRNPKPPPPSEEEQAVFKEADRETRKEILARRVELARRRAVIERNRYVITRLHHRYDRAGLPKDVSVAAAGHVRGGVGAPQGPEGALSSAVQPSDQSQFQVRYTFFHPSKKQVDCESPTPNRWGMAPASYRGLRKTWTARDMAYKKRNRFEPAEVMFSSVPALGIEGKPLRPEDAAPKAAEAAPEEDGGCSVSSGAPRRSSSTWWAALVLGGGLSLARARRRRGAPARWRSPR